LENVTSKSTLVHRPANQTTNSALHAVLGRIWFLSCWAYNKFRSAGKLRTSPQLTTMLPSGKDFHISIPGWQPVLLTITFLA